MKRLSLLLFVLLLAPQVWAATPVRKGSVSCQGQGIPGVAVTDGIRTTTTDARGRFSLPVDDNARFVYISTPAGYSSPTQEQVVKFYIPIDQARKTYDFALTRAANDQTRHGFVVAADPQLFEEREFELLATAAEDIRATVEAEGVPFHGICVGDLISKDHTFYPRYNQVMATTGLAWRNAMGNHDMKIWGRSHETSVGPFEAMYGPSYYSYNVGQIHYIVLNDNFFIGRDWFYIGYLDERQLRWIESDLHHLAAGSTVVVALHIPTTYKDKDTTPFSYEKSERSLCNHKALYSLLEPYNAHIVSGHMHTTTNSELGEGLYEHNLAALSGAWWQGAICTDGTPAGYGVFLADGEQISWYYKSTGHPKEHQIKIYDQRDDEAFAGRIVANVWDSDSAWRIEMRADGGQAVAMEPFRATDPEARALYADPSKLVHKWITLVPSDHYRIATPPAHAKHIEVTATDRFGNTYRAEKTLQQ